MTTTQASAGAAAPPSAYKPADWREVPKGFYALPVYDWMLFQDEITGEGETPLLELLGYLMVQRKVPRAFKNGKVTGQDALVQGAKMLAVNPDYPGTPEEMWKRLTDEVRRDAYFTRHEHWAKTPGDIPCRCPECQHWRRLYESMGLEPTDLYPAENQHEAWPNALAGMIMTGADGYRELFGKLTGRCGYCGKLLTDSKSKLIGIGPDCRGYR